VVESLDGAVVPSVQRLDEARLPDGDVTVDIDYSTLNHQDGMIIKGMGNLVRQYPHVPGCDFAGTVAESRHPAVRAGDKVLLTGWGVGALHWGGFAQKARVRGDWLMPLPERLSPRSAMAIGSPGFVAMLAVATLEAHGLAKERGEVLVTGTPGGVGSMALALLARRGYSVFALVRDTASADYVRCLGAAGTIDRSELDMAPPRPLEKARWAACIDSVGGDVLARVLAQMAFGGSIAVIGLGSSRSLSTTTLPFIVRAVSLIGIHSDNCPTVQRSELWQRLADELPEETLDLMTREAGLEDLSLLAGIMLEGGVSGRIVVDVNR